MSDSLRPVPGEPTLEQWTNAVGPDPMRLPDGIVEGTDASDWTAAITALVALGWTAEWRRDEATESPLPADKLFVRSADEGCGVVALHSPGGEVRVHLWPYTPSELLFDFDLRELHDARRWSVFVSFVQAVSAAVGRDVDLFHEGSTIVFARFHAETRSWSLVRY